MVQIQGGENMKLTKLAIAAATALAVATPAAAEMVFPLLSYRTGPYAPNGIPFADGVTDYFTLLNERDGGIGGVKINMIECETAYNTDKGVECYESTKGQGALYYQPLSTGITYQLIPKVDQEGGSLQGKKIALVYHNSAYGKEPIRTLEELAKKHGYSLMLLPVDHPGQEQKATWLQIRKEKPDYTLMWGWGVMNQVAVKEAAAIRYPMDHFIGVWWSASENDTVPAGDGAHGYKAVTFHGVGRDYPVYDDLQKHVYDAGKSAGAGDQHGFVLYNRGMVSAMWAAEAARTAQKIHGVKEITPAMMRDGFEALEVDQKRLAELGLGGFTVAVNVSCASHGGPGLGAIQQWDAKSQSWSIITPYVEADR
jgi:branched-chain amino acid transport system substrate-binding protein